MLITGDILLDIPVIRYGQIIKKYFTSRYNQPAHPHEMMKATIIAIIIMKVVITTLMTTYS